MHSDYNQPLFLQVKGKKWKTLFLLAENIQMC